MSEGSPRFASEEPNRMHCIPSWLDNIPTNSLGIFLNFAQENINSSMITGGALIELNDKVEEAIMEANNPTDVPTNPPTYAPTGAPTDSPTDTPSDEPTNIPMDSQQVLQDEGSTDTTTPTRDSSTVSYVTLLDTIIGSSVGWLEISLFEERIQTFLQYIRNTKQIYNLENEGNISYCWNNGC